MIKSLFNLSFNTLWKFKMFKHCDCFFSHISCQFCFKTLILMQNEYNFVKKLIMDESLTNYNIFVDNYHYNPTKLQNNSLKFVFERVTLTTNDLNIFKKYIILHCLYQYNIKLKLLFPNFLYNINFYIYKKDDRIIKINKCTNFVDQAYKALSGPDFNKIKIIGIRSIKTQDEILSKVNRDVNILIGIWIFFVFISFIFLLICINFS